jgi:uncharacterized membrane protein
MDTTTEQTNGHGTPTPPPANPAAALVPAVERAGQRAQELVARVEGTSALDPAVEALHAVADRVPPAARRILGGEPIGHPAHPLMTDLPIGFWTTSFCLDLLGGRRAARASTLFVGAGILTVLPTAATGLVDWTYLSPGKRRAGVVHLTANLAATAAYTASFAARVRGRRGRGVALGLVGATLATAGGYLGGHLAFGEDSTDDA